MIKIEFEGMCKGCQHADIELNNDVIFTDLFCVGAEPNAEYYCVPCSHQKVCEMWEQKLDDLRFNKA